MLDFPLQSCVSKLTQIHTCPKNVCLYQGLRTVEWSSQQWLPTKSEQGPPFIFEFRIFLGKTVNFLLFYRFCHGAVIKCCFMLFYTFSHEAEIKCCRPSHLAGPAVEYDVSMAVCFGAEICPTFKRRLFALWRGLRPGQLGLSDERAPVEKILLVKHILLDSFRNI